MIAAAVHVLLEIACALIVLTVVFVLSAVAVNERRDRRRRAADRAAVVRNAQALGIGNYRYPRPHVVRDREMRADVVEDLMLRRKQHEQGQR